MIIGVLALQGDFHEHLVSFKNYGFEGVEVRTIADLNQVDALIIPGGESTVIAKLMMSTGLDKEIIKRVKTGMPIWGVCAGAIVLGRDVLNLIDVMLERNSYGRQIDSFGTELKIGNKLTEVQFIRAPRVVKKGKGVRVLVNYKGDAVMMRSGNILISTFHSELGGDNLGLEIFLKMLKTWHICLVD